MYTGIILDEKNSCQFEAKSYFYTSWIIRNTIYASVFIIVQTLSSKLNDVKQLNMYLKYKQHGTLNDDTNIMLLVLLYTNVCILDITFNYNR